MKTFLGIDCSTRRTNIGLAIDDKPIGEMNLDLGREQSALLPLLVEHLLTFMNMDLQDIDRIAVTVGPGYFTGIRVGLSYAVALAEGIGVPVIPICSLEAVASGSVFQDEQILIPMIWGNKRSVYAGAYMSPAMKNVDMLPAGSYTVQDMASFLNRLDNKPILLSPEKTRCQQLFQEMDWKIMNSPIRGGIVASLAYRKIESSMKPEYVKARYYREPDIGKPKGAIL